VAQRHSGVRGASPDGQRIKAAEADLQAWLATQEGDEGDVIAQGTTTGSRAGNRQSGTTCGSNNLWLKQVAKMTTSRCRNWPLSGFIESSLNG